MKKLFRDITTDHSGPQSHHMKIPWHNLIISDDGIPAVDASLKEKATLIGRIGLMMLSCGTGSWRIRESLNYSARALDVSCTADIGLLSINCTCFDGSRTYTQVLSLPSSGVNTTKLMNMEIFIREFSENAADCSIGRLHEILDDIQGQPGHYGKIKSALASAFACFAFTFLLGGGPVEMIGAFIGAGFGNFVRKLMLGHRLALIASVAVSVAAACVAYVAAFSAAHMIWGINSGHEAGYICAMLFIIPGFPLITGGIDLAKLDMRSGLERLSYAILIILTATMTGWCMALLLHYHPADLIGLELTPLCLCLLRMVMSFAGVFGFSMMFNSTYSMAATAGVIGMIANTLRLELVDLASMPIGIAAFLGALCAGLMASVVKRKTLFPRISLTVPSIVIMVPGLYMYRSIYYIGLQQIDVGALWLTRAILIVMALPAGLVCARMLTDRHFLHDS